MKLDFEQRQEAERLIAEAQDEDALRALMYELVALRDKESRSATGHS